MNGHADTIRYALPPLGSHTVLIREQRPLEDAYAALDALVAENQQQAQEIEHLLYEIGRSARLVAATGRSRIRV